MKKVFWLCVAMIFFIATACAATQPPLSADQAFQLSAAAKDDQTILLKWHIAPGYYLYQQRFAFHVMKPTGAQLGEPLYPTDTEILKTTLGNFSVYAKSVVIPLPIIQSSEKTLVLQVKYQGCSKFGYCYPPTTKTVAVNLSGNYMQFVLPIQIDVAPTIKQILPVSKQPSLFLSIIFFFGMGVLLSLTPCVLPMIPILSSIIIGQKNKSHLHAFFLSLCYVLGTALSYMMIGILFALLGKNLSVLFQQSWIMICASIVYAIMGLSLFGLFQIQLPEKLRGYIANISHHQNSGSYISAFIMGALSILILSPCVTPPLAAALLLIVATKEMAMGSLLLFVLGIGMGTPLLLIGALGPRILPKPGKWMNGIKYFFGTLLLVIALMLFVRTKPEWFSLPFFTATQTESPLKFKSVNTINDINTVIQQANKDNKIVMLDFYASWCLACKEFDASTFRDPSIKSALSHIVLLRVDVTNNSADDQLVEKHFGVIAPPTILFFYQGKELKSARIIGYQNPQQFTKTMHKLQKPEIAPIS